MTRTVAVPRLAEKMLGVRDFIDGMTLHTASGRGALEMKEEICRRQLQAIARQAHLDCVGCPYMDLRQDEQVVHTRDSAEIRTSARCKEQRCVHVKTATRPIGPLSVADYYNSPNDPYEAPPVETYTRSPPYDESVEMARDRILDLKSQIQNPALDLGRQAHARIMMQELERRTHPQMVERTKLLRDQEELAQAIEEATGKSLEEAIVPPKPAGWGQW